MEVETIRQIALFIILLLILSGIVVSIPVTASPNPSPEIKQEIDDTWYLSQSFRLSDNTSFSVTVQSVEFTFLYSYVEPGILDIPTRIYVQVRFTGGETEILETSVGGYVLMNYRLAQTEHTKPQAAIISAYGEGHEWYSWYYAASPDATNYTGEPVSYSVLYYSIAGFAWIIVLSFIAFDYRRRVVSVKLGTY